MGGVQRCTNLEAVDFSGNRVTNRTTSSEVRFRRCRFPPTGFDSKSNLVWDVIKPAHV